MVGCVEGVKYILEAAKLLCMKQTCIFCFTKFNPATWSAWFPASTRPRSFEVTGRQGSDLLTPGQKPAKLLKLLNPYLENRLSVACVQSFFRVS